jgi:hypothetical protein
MRLKVDDTDTEEGVVGNSIQRRIITQHNTVVLSPNIERRLRLGCRCLSVGRHLFWGGKLGKITLLGTSHVNR